ncbi:hypothetical protein [Sphingosinicella sp. CPCC 101087]|uniref:hypothetical protein n=1 Tax=Sphingosinicella sp. CPCC 101087 TaxID=2497754 RepID=UPI0013ED3AC2|nr:hypothetical protein [Sphingosinicella sp. CPCC 101087]
MRTSRYVRVMRHPRDMPAPASGGRALAYQTFALFLIALLVRLLGNGSMPVHVDEFYHLLAGQSWADDGSLAILDGAYPRAAGYTALTGLTFLVFGEAGMFVARLPALLAGALLVPIMFHWTAINVNLRTAWLAALMLCFADSAIEQSQFARFYTLHALLIWLGATATYGALCSGRPLGPSVLRLLGAAVCYVAALHLQVTTLIHLAGLGLFVVGYVLTRPAAMSAMSERRFRSLLVVAAIALLFALVALGVASPLASEFRQTSLWAEEHRNDILFYARNFVTRMPILTVLALASVGFVVLRRLRAGYFCLALIAVPFIAHSLAGMKSFRYLLYALPFFFVLAAIATDLMLSALSRLVASRSAAMDRMGRATISLSARPIVTTVLLGLVAFAAIAGNWSIARSVKRIAVDAHQAAIRPASLVSPPPDWPWQGASSELRNAIGNPSLFVVADDLRAVHYLGTFDLLINRSRISDIVPAVEFGRDFRTGRRVVGSGALLAEIAACYPDGAILVPNERWGVHYAVPPDVTRAIEDFAQPTGPGVEGFHLYRWRHSPRGARCPYLRARIADRSA